MPSSKVVNRGTSEASNNDDSNKSLSHKPPKIVKTWAIFTVHQLQNYTNHTNYTNYSNFTKPYELYVNYTNYTKLTQLYQSNWTAHWCYIVFNWIWIALYSWRLLWIFYQIQQHVIWFKAWQKATWQTEVGKTLPVTTLVNEHIFLTSQKNKTNSWFPLWPRHYVYSEWLIRLVLPMWGSMAGEIYFTHLMLTYISEWKIILAVVTKKYSLLQKKLNLHLRCS